MDYNNHTELAFVLELPKELGEAQKELGIEKEASYIITVINPKTPRREEYLPTTEDAPNTQNLFLMTLTIMRILCCYKET